MGTKIRSNAASVRFEEVTKVYGTNVIAVKEMSLHIEAGQLVTLLGPSGCGKTTTLRMIAGLEIPTTGRITIGGTYVTRPPPTARAVRSASQSYALFPPMPMLQQLT